MPPFAPNREDVPLDHELATRVGWFIQLRWLAGAAVLLGATLALLLGQPHAGSLYAVGAAILAYNAALTYVHRHVTPKGHHLLAWRHLFTHLQVALDWVALTILSALTGGLESPLLLFFTFHVILAAMLLPRWECLAETTVGLLLIAAMAYGRWQGAPLHATDGPLATLRLYDDPVRATTYFVAIAGMLYICAFLASSIAVRLRHRERDLLDAKEREERMHAEMALLHELAKSITATLDLDAVLRDVSEQAARVMQARACSIRLLAESGDLYIGATYGLSDAYLAKGPVGLAHSPVDRRALLGETVIIEDVEREGLFQYPEEAVREGIRSVLCVPLMAGRNAVGVVRVYGDRTGAFDEDDVRFLQHFSSLAAIAINNARTCRVLQDVDRERARFTRTVAHELRSPLAAILGNVRIILDGYVGPVPERAAQLLTRAHQRGTQLLALASDLLALVSGRERAAEPRQEPILLGEVTRQVIGDLEEEARAKSLDYEARVADGSLEMLGDRDQMVRLVENLVSNAIKYTPERGRVSVSLQGDEGSLELIVADTGIGIPREMRDRVFEEFFRAENARHFSEGTGLGLTIVKRIVEAHHGKIALETEEGKGTCLTVVFPRHRPEPEPARAMVGAR
ncbi:MAG: GAF domain-containing protein [Armatimonadetes bacterium]|nr:GAF domain-containing protein [Armatimonadota bacterium]